MIAYEPQRGPHKCDLRVNAHPPGLIPAVASSPVGRSLVPQSGRVGRSEGVRMVRAPQAKGRPGRHLGRITATFLAGAMTLTVASLAGAGTAGASGPSPTWTQLSPTTSPTARGGSSMAYDPATSQLILFGGDGSAPNQFFSDTWAWNGTTTTWVQLHPTTHPPALADASMAYDPATSQLLLFGGTTTGFGLLNSTWTWNGTTWTELSPATSPSPRVLATMAYDSATSQLVLFGGDAGSMADLNDTWTWNGTTWTELSPATSPVGRNYATMAYDPAVGQLVLFGGAGAGGYLNDTWTWNGTTWTELSPATPPPVREAASMAYDPAAGQVVLFGGFGGSGPATLNDTWTWDGTTWTQQSPTTSPPTAGVMADDVGTGQLLMFGVGNGTTLGNQTWVYGGTSLAPPVFTSAAGATIPTRTPFSFTVTTTGTPTPAISLASGSTLPSGITLTDNGDGTATLTGSTTVAATDHFTFEATNGVSPNAVQVFTLTVTGISGEPPVFTSSDSATMIAGTEHKFAITTTAVPDAFISVAPGSSLPGGVSLGGGNNRAILDVGASVAPGIYQFNLKAANGVPPNAIQSYTLTVKHRPVFTSAASDATPSGSPFTFTVSTTGPPPPAITLASGSTLPSGVSLTDNGNGTATLAGTASVVPGVYHFTFQAANGVTPNTTQAFALTLTQSPAITSRATSTFTIGTAKAFAFTATGAPKPSVTLTGALPSGVTFTSTPGRGLISGTAAAGTAGTYPLTITATNSVGTVSQGFTLTVKT